METYTLRSGAKIPAFGLGTWKSKKGEVEKAVKEALKIGYKHLDCAAIYGNETEVGQALASYAGPRHELWVTSKLWNSAHQPEDVRPALERTLLDLRLTHLDLYLIHWPIHFTAGVVFPRSADQFLPPDAIPVEETWQALEECVQAGLTTHIGVSNFTAQKIDALMRTASIMPAINQIELHPYLQQDAMLNYGREKGILLTAYAPLGSGDRPKIMKKAGEPVLLQNKTILETAIKHKATPGQVLIAWALARGTVVIPKSVNQKRLRENFKAQQIELDQEDMAHISALDLEWRFVDGENFCTADSPYTLDWLWNE